MGAVYTDVAELAADIAAKHPAPALIGVDGWTGAGKTQLAAALAQQTGGATFDVDAALVRDQGCFVPALRLAHIEDALTQGDKLLFLSGICLRSVLALVGRDADAHIYVRRMAAWGWTDEDDVEGNLSEVPGRGAALRCEMRAYHDRYQPHAAADYFFDRLG